ncbi:MAG: hypothetical protein JST84_05010 [Acidobacteria bacterium]|nr:hypothetical protein [Acidobacteriota bacterium]
MPNYNTRFDPHEIEEKITAILRGHKPVEGDSLTENDYQFLAPQILQAVVKDLRPDLLKTATPPETFLIGNYIPHPEKPGYQKFTGNKTFNEVLAAVEKFLVEQKLNHHEWIIAGDIVPDNSDQPIPEYREMLFQAGHGNNEGYYTQIAYVTKDHKLHNLIRIKHFEGLEYAFKLAEALNRFLEY